MIKMFKKNVKMVDVCVYFNTSVQTADLVADLDHISKYFGNANTNKSGNRINRVHEGVAVTNGEMNNYIMAELVIDERVKRRIYDDMYIGDFKAVLYIVG